MLDLSCMSAAIAIGAQMYMIRWCYHMEEDNDEEEKETKKNEN